MKRKARSKPEWQKKIAKERISILFDEAHNAVKEDRNIESARRYMKIAKKIGMRYNIRLSERKKKFCSNCYNYFYAGVTCTQRTKNSKIIIHCLNCDKITRFLLKK